MSCIVLAIAVYIIIVIVSVIAIFVVTVPANAILDSSRAKLGNPIACLDIFLCAVLSSRIESFVVVQVYAELTSKVCC